MIVEALSDPDSAASGTNGQLVSQQAGACKGSYVSLSIHSNRQVFSEQCSWFPYTSLVLSIELNERRTDLDPITVSVISATSRGHHLAF